MAVQDGLLKPILRGGGGEAELVGVGVYLFHIKLFW